MSERLGAECQWVKPHNLEKFWIEVRQAIQVGHCKKGHLSNRIGSKQLFAGSQRGRPNAGQLWDFINWYVDKGKAPAEFCIWWKEYDRGESTEPKPVALVTALDEQKAEIAALTAGRNELERDVDAWREKHVEALSNVKALRDVLDKKDLEIESLRKAAQAHGGEVERLKKDLRDMTQLAEEISASAPKSSPGPDPATQERIEELESEVEALREMLAARPASAMNGKANKAELLKEMAGKGLVNFDALAKMLEDKQ